MRAQVAITALMVMLVVATVFAVWPAFGAPWISSSRTVSDATAEERCKESRLYRQKLEHPPYREKTVAVGIAAIRLYRNDMDMELLRQAEEAQYDGHLTLAAADIAFWCNQ